MAEPEAVLTFWVIYYGARNHPPGVWVVRAQDVVRGSMEPRPHAVFIECSSLAAARAAVPRGLTCIVRSPDDDPVIVESWF
jgi:hypothetical protein